MNELVRSTMSLAHEGDYIDQLQQMTTEARFDHWLHHEVFSYQWWFLLFLLIVPWILLIKFIDKTRLFELMCYVVMLAYITTVLDAIGTELHIWSYSNKLLPLFNRLMPIDFSLLPITYVCVYCWFNKWKSFIIAQFILSFGAAFVAEPILIWMEIYQPHHWKHYYSFPIYILLGILMRWLFLRMKETSYPHTVRT